ncbi:major capsid protein [Pseudovibrio sp. Tun.PSC04-5.I4]|uniref:major capsid protein n=1 Tax=Pseudovibrio sp. Tun.PSC04-5.I4 TaxID=1798213 RepID=UPI0008839114|nr:major capsid protein [Pseudovibrio sp. Tun.PSC04-5.I4]SDQ99633.1 Phage major capsid protein E [Pseudovibrio sp. Tun.PSC04-5.I4]
MDHYTLQQLLLVVETLFTPKRFYLDRYFKLEHLSDKEEIIIDDVFEKQVTLAPFVMPLVAGKPQEAGGFTAKTFRPAYVKPMNVVKPTDAITRMAGESFGGDLSNMDRFERLTLKHLFNQKMQIEARWEWMGRMALIAGKITVTGEDYPSVLIDFGRDADNVVVNTDPNHKWSNTDYDIMGEIEGKSTHVASKVSTPATDLHMAPELWPHFKKNKSIKDELDLTKRNDSTITTSPAATDPENPVMFKGMVGNFAVYVDASTYRDEAGVEHRYLPAGHAALIAPTGQAGTSGVYGVRGFGVILDKKAELKALPIFPKVWENNNPSVDMVMSQSAPLMIPGRPNGAFVWKGLL